MEDTELFSALSEAGEFQTEGSFSCRLRSIKLFKTCVDNIVFSSSGTKAVSDEIIVFFATTEKLCIRSRNSKGSIMADVTLHKEAFESYNLALPSNKRASDSQGELPLASSKKSTGIHWGVSAKDLWIHVDMAKDILSDESASLVFEYPKEDQKFLITYQKGGKEHPIYGYAHLLNTYVYDYIVPALDFKEERLSLSAIFPAKIVKGVMNEFKHFPDSHFLKVTVRTGFPFLTLKYTDKTTVSLKIKLSDKHVNYLIKSNAVFSYALESLRQALMKATENVTISLMINQEGFLLVHWNAEKNVQIKSIVHPKIDPESEDV